MHIKFLQSFISWLSRLICGVTVFSKGPDLDNLPQAILYANHASHFDFIAIWSSLPRHIRRQVRPVAALDVWGKAGLYRFFSQRVFNSILIERTSARSGKDPLIEVRTALATGDSIIIFPEGTRSMDGAVMDFKSGLFHLAKDFPHLPLIPVYLDNLNRILPRGEFLIVPLLSRVTFGPALHLVPDEDKPAFLSRAKSALEALT